ncbi:lipoyl synthase [Candidatus Calescamantes bacterium]|nr:lipoyl synthase [Candidatus Calescamantes bacterium]
MRKEFPPWLKKRIGDLERVNDLLSLLSHHRLHTICQSAHCPNLPECFSRGTATFLILGNICTRNCTFCMVKKGKPLPVDTQEPERIKEMAKLLGLKYVVITSVTRDDLPDGGAEHFKRTIRTLHEEGMKAEVLVPDFQGDKGALVKVVEEKPEVFAHNLETVPRLYPSVRPQADYDRSLLLLRWAKEVSPSQITKSGIMVGMGEREEEVIEVMKSARDAGVDIFTIGQYLPPSPRHFPLHSFIHPETFHYYEREGEKMGLLVIAGPWVRSSYRAETAWKTVVKK